MGRIAPTKTSKHAVDVAPAPAAPTNAEVPHLDTHRAKRAIPRDTAIMIALHTTLNKVIHVHDPVDPQEADRIFSFAVSGLADQILLPIFTSGQHVLEGGGLAFQTDTQPVAPSSDRHASKLVRKRVKRRKQSYAAAVKTSIYGNYAASRASSRTESRFGGSRFGGSRASASVWGAVSKAPRMSLIYGLGHGGESLMNSSWIGSQQGSIGTTSNWSPGAFSSTKIPSPPPSVAGTARVAVDIAELQRRADIERDLNTRESVRRAKEELSRKGDLRLKLRSLADPTVSLEMEEATLTALGAKGSRSRIQHSRQGARAKVSGASLSSVDTTRANAKNTMASTLAADETTTFRTEDYEGLTSDVVLFSKSGELLVDSITGQLIRRSRRVRMERGRRGKFVFTSRAFFGKQPAYR
ncbi:TRAF3-interacting protein 1 isoform 1 [Phytophthora cinnamomi]|uniref:TRAF3-interacting protein 1 isoform 1 n=1 Tax=Phytophthora cinnamomi TaxID=4785 RepID=UPI003559964A|nr:TRAF3-interacting protein 1 isoform 1 [Phytophthora cinnamomi]